jgi:hypothetical protein
MTGRMRVAGSKRTPLDLSIAKAQILPLPILRGQVLQVYPVYSRRALPCAALLVQEPSCSVFVRSLPVLDLFCRGIYGSSTLSLRSSSGVRVEKLVNGRPLQYASATSPASGRAALRPGFRGTFHHRKLETRKLDRMRKVE